MKGARGGSFYALALPREIPSAELPQGNEGAVVAFVRQHGSIRAGECAELLGWASPQRAGRFLRKLTSQGVLRAAGEKRGRRYILP